MRVNETAVTLAVTAGRADQFPKDKRPQIVFSGKSNVGKSSLINSLIMKKALARVSSSPGKTITINFYNVDGKVYFVDLPGYGFAKRSDSEKVAWSKLTDGFFTAGLPRGSKVVQLVDIRTGLGEDDRDMISYLESTGTPYLIALTKADKVSKTAAEEAVSAIKESGLAENAKGIIPYSSVKSTGRIELLKAIFSGI